MLVFFIYLQLVYIVNCLQNQLINFSMGFGKYESEKATMGRRVYGYLSPRNFKIFHADKAHFFQRGISEHIGYIVDLYIKSMSEVKQQQLLEEYDKKIVKKFKINP